MSFNSFFKLEIYAVAQMDKKIRRTLICLVTDSLNSMEN